MPDESGKRGWFERFSSTLALIFTIIAIVFSTGVAWAVMQEREYVNNKVNEITKQQNDRYEKILMELGKLQGNK